MLNAMPDMKQKDICDLMNFNHVFCLANYKHIMEGARKKSKPYTM